MVRPQIAGYEVFSRGVAVLAAFLWAMVLSETGAIAPAAPRMPRDWRPQMLDVLEQTNMPDKPRQDRRSREI